MNTAFIVALLIPLVIVAVLIPAYAITNAVRRNRETKQVSHRLATQGYVGVAFVRSRMRKHIQHGFEELYRFELEVEGIDGARFPAFAEEFLPRTRPITTLGQAMNPPYVHGEETSLVPVRYLPGEPRVAFEPMQSPDAQEALARYNARRGLTG